MYSTVAQALLLLSASTSAVAWWQPTPGTTWEIVLSKTLDDIGTLPPVQALDADLEDNDAELWQSVKDQGYRTICYFSAGSYEDWRSDADSFPPEAIGSPLDDWEGEAWLDTRNEDVRDIMRARIDAAAEKGCDAIDPDNLDVYEHDGGGFDLTIDNAVDYVQFLSEYAHSKDLAVGLKNGGQMVQQVLDSVDFEVNEQCQEFNCPDCDEPYYECALFQPFIDAGKAVFRIEYEESTPTEDRTEEICGWEHAEGFSTLIKFMELDERSVRCP